MGIRISTNHRIILRRCAIIFMIRSLLPFSETSNNKLADINKICVYCHNESQIESHGQRTNLFCRFNHQQKIETIIAETPDEWIYLIKLTIRTFQRKHKILSTVYNFEQPYLLGRASAIIDQSFVARVKQLIHVNDDWFIIQDTRTPTVFSTCDDGNLLMKMNKHHHNCNSSSNARLKAPRKGFNEGCHS